MNECFQGKVLNRVKLAKRYQEFFSQINFYSLKPGNFEFVEPLTSFTFEGKGAKEIELSNMLSKMGIE